AGRGVIVHHDPVVRHRGSGSSSGPSQSGRRSRGNGHNNNSNANANSGSAAPTAASNGGTHSITETAKSALAQIAASTLVPTTEPDAAAQSGSSDTHASAERGRGSSHHKGNVRSIPETVADIVLPNGNDDTPSEGPRKRKKRRSSSGGGAPATTTAPAREVAPPKSEKEQLLDSVLNALPEPKAPGQGRGRRRVTTAALT